MPNIFGRTNSDITIKTSVRLKEISADTFPFDNAVKNPEDVMLIPLNKKLMANILKPAEASSHVCCSFVKTVTITGENITATVTTNTEEIITNKKAIL